MRCLTNSECAEWLRSHEIDGVSKHGSQEVTGDFEILFAAPREARIQACLVRELVAWVGEFKTALFWISDWPFYKPDEMAIVEGLRRAHGECRRLIEAPGHLFEWEERDELIGWIALMMSFGWDGHLFVSPFHGAVFQTSHEDFVRVTTSCAEHFAAVKQLVHNFKAEINRETKPTAAFLSRATSHS